MPVEGSALDRDSPAAQCGKDRRRSSAEGTPHGDVGQPAEEGLVVWTGVDFSVCVVAPPESEAWGQAVGKRVSKGRAVGGGRQPGRGTRGGSRGGR